MKQLGSHWANCNENLYLIIFRKSVEKIQNVTKLWQVNRVLFFHEDLCMFMTVPRRVILRMRNVSDESCREYQNTLFVCNNLFFTENHAIYEVIWKNMVEPDGPQMTIWRVRFACWITKATNTIPEYVIITAFPRQKWLSERASVLCLYIYCLPCNVLEHQFSNCRGKINHAQRDSLAK